MTSGLFAWLAPTAPRERAAAVRGLVGAFATVYLVVRFPYLTAHHAAGELAPVGVCAFLRAPLPDALTSALAVLGIVLGTAFTAGRGARVVGPSFFLVLLWLLSYASSWGKILHSENLMLLHVGVLAAAGSLQTERASGWALRTMSIVTVLTYFVAGISKLRSGGALWLSGKALGDWLAWDTVRKIELGSFHSPLAAHVGASSTLLMALAIFTLTVEIGAPAALLSRRLARVWVLLAWMFHVGILATMMIGFFYPLTVVAFVSFGRPERVGWLRRLASRTLRG